MEAPLYPGQRQLEHAFIHPSHLIAPVLMLVISMQFARGNQTLDGKGHKETTTSGMDHLKETARSLWGLVHPTHEKDPKIVQAEEAAAKSMHNRVYGDGRVTDETSPYPVKKRGTVYRGKWHEEPVDTHVDLAPGESLGTPVYGPDGEEVGARVYGPEGMRIVRFK